MAVETFFRIVGEKALQNARRLGVEAEVFLSRSRELSIQVRDGQVETLKHADELGLGVRVISQGRSGFAFTSDPSSRSVEAVVADAVSISRFTSRHDFNSFPRGDYVYLPMDLYDSAIEAASLEEKIELAREMECRARACDRKITNVEQAAYEEGSYETLIMNTLDLYAFKRGNLCSTSIAVVAEEQGEAQTGFSLMIQRRFDRLSPSTTGREAAGKALRQLGASPVSSGKMPCIMDPYVTTRFLNVIAQMADADAVFKGRSMLAGKKGRQVASPQCTLTDDSLLDDGVGSTPFDGEGVPGRKTLVIEGGVLKEYLYDHYSAAREGRVSTGNARRSSYRSLPVIGASNLILQAGENSPAKLMADMDRGFYITEVMGMHMVNPVSGEFSVGASGLLIRNGCPDQPVRGVTIAGNIMDLLKNIDALGNDLKYFGSRGAPSILVNGLSIGGR